MFCINCGKQIPDGQRLCTECAAQDQPQPQPQTPAEPPKQPEFEVSTPAKTPGKKPDMKKIAIIAGAAVLVVAILLTALNWGSIARFFGRTFSSPEAYLENVELQNAEEAAKTISDGYAEVLSSLEVQNTGANKTDVTIRMGDSLLNMLENLLAEESISLDLGWVEEINLSVTAQDGDLAATDIGIGLNGVQLLTVSAIADMDTMELYLAIPEVNQRYLLLDLAELADADIDQLQAAMTQSAELTRKLLTVLPEPEELEALILRYAKLLLSSFENVEKANETLEVDGLKQQLLMLTVTMTEQELYDTVVRVLEEARQDETLKGILQGLQEYAAQLPGAEDMGDIAAQYESGIDELLAGLRENEAEVDDRQALELITYLDGEDNIAGRTVRVLSDEEELELHYIMVVEGGEFAFEAEASAATVTGSGTVKKNAYTGEFLLNVFGNDFVTLEVEDLVLEGTATGTLRVIPESGLLSEMGMDSSVSALAGGNLALELELNGADVVMSILFGGEKMLSVGVSSTTVNEKDVVVPGDAIEFVDENSLLLWVMELKLDTLIGNMEAAGVPAELVNALRSLGGMLSIS